MNQDKKPSSDKSGAASPAWMLPDDDFLRIFLARPELAPQADSCVAELALHSALIAGPRAAVTPDMLSGLQDADARDNYALFLRFRDRLLTSGSLEACYLGLFRPPGAGNIDIPPLFIDLLAEAIAGGLIETSGDAYQHRAADMLSRSQLISVQQSQLLAGDRDTLDMLNETAGLGDIGRLLSQAGAPLPTLNLQVLGDGNAAEFFASRRSAAKHRFLLDLTHEVSNESGHGLVLTMTRARSGLTALSRVLEQWVQHFLGVTVSIRPLQKISDESWRWHVGLDAQATALLNDLYEGREVDPVRMNQLVSLFRLDFADAQEMRADLAGRPVYLGLMMDSQGVVKLKPQNLLVNLPLRSAS